jgi:hypothetical protein
VQLSNEGLADRVVASFSAPVTVPTCERATAFWIETTLIGKVVPSPSANSDSRASSTHSGSGVATASTAAIAAANALPMIATRL